MRRIIVIIIVLISTSLFFSFCTGEKNAVDNLPEGVQAISVLGDTLYTPVFSETNRQNLQKNLAEAQTAYEKNQNDADAIIWLGRRTAYLGEYRKALNIYSKAIKLHPDDARMYRHRGHRYITTRQFDKAITDFEYAAKLIQNTSDQVEPDGAPNARNIPTSTLQSNIWYHLGLAYYLQGEFGNALEAYKECMKVSNNPDMQVATSHWLYMTLMRLGKTKEAEQVLVPIKRNMDIIENSSYFKLLLMYKGELDVESLQSEGHVTLDDATTGYGLGNWYYYNDRKEDAKQIFQRIVAGDQWASFGYIAAEAELSRM